MGSHQDFRSLQAKFQASQPETSELPKKSPKPEFNKLLKRFPQPELGEHPKKPPQPEFTDLPKKPCKLESSELSKKLPQLEAPQKPPQPELSNTPRLPIEPKFSAFPRKFQQPEPNEATPKPLQPEFSALPKKPLQPEFCVLPRKPPQPQVSDLPKKSLLHPESSEVPPTPPSKPEFGESHLHSSQHNFSTLPKKPPQPEFCVLPRKPPQPQPRVWSQTAEITSLQWRLEAGPQIWPPTPAEASALGQQPGPPSSQAPTAPRPQGHPELLENLSSKHRWVRVARAERRGSRLPGSVRLPPSALISPQLLPASTSRLDSPKTSHRTQMRPTSCTTTWSPQLTPAPAPRAEISLQYPGPHLL
ncbi:PML-RARA-regulated adapter molecule 1 isoform X8 [Hippopotamus amphibius kiboko]|uniref:PML-RARA-regulated adapter molecule 1 isoform X8 n=1 Tax=Hippopotamus amphibius kiboko TaxID=575201 RepID=UPI00259764F9|nr:PML-RARA-regulated adapter molecule 1 isoform X8 [Hippopotamus amphibius kiboko]